MVGIIYICTGKYTIFWKDFFISMEKNFLPNWGKQYFVFTDSPGIYAEENLSVKRIYQKDLGWPGNTLFRFEIFTKVEEELAQCEYIFFLNANMLIVDVVNDEILPDHSNDGLLAVLHPGFWNKANYEFTYERNESSLAHIAMGRGKYYFMGGFNGGTKDAYLSLIKTLKNNIQKDFQKNITALWHDESHLNQYLLDKNPKILLPEYGYPEGWNLPFNPKILIRDKTKYGGHDFLRNLTITSNYSRIWKELFNQVKRFLTHKNVKVTEEKINFKK